MRKTAENNGKHSIKKETFNSGKKWKTVKNFSNSKFQQI